MVLSWFVFCKNDRPTEEDRVAFLKINDTVPHDGVPCRFFAGTRPKNVYRNKKPNGPLECVVKKTTRYPGDFVWWTCLVDFVCGVELPYT